MTVDAFFKKYEGKGVDFDGYYGFQCMDLAEQYNNEVVNAPRLGGNAVDVWNHYPTNFYKKIANTPTGIPQLGDIMIWGQGVGQYGHIAVFYAGDVNNFTSFDQNWPLGSVCHFQVHSYKNLLGWLHPNNLPQEPVNVIIPVTGQAPVSTPTPQPTPAENPQTPPTAPDPVPTPIPDPVPPEPPVLDTPPTDSTGSNVEVGQVPETPQVVSGTQPVQSLPVNPTESLLNALQRLWGAILALFRR